MRNLSFSLAPSEVLEPVGENGPGRTTFVKLLAWPHDPVELRVLLGERNLHGSDLLALRAAIGVIFQDVVHYNLPVANNIAVDGSMLVAIASG